MAGPSSFQRYQVDEVCRVEALGRVLRARLPELNRAVWILELCPPVTLAPEERERLLLAFDAECRALTDLHEPRVVSPCDLGRTDSGGRFLVFDRLEAGGFAPLPADRSALPVDAWLNVAGEAAAALAALEEAGIQWHTFAPECCFRSPAGELRVLPIELSHLVAAAQLPAAFRRADPALSAPELHLGKAPEPSSLVFSLAAWLYARLAPAEGAPPALTALGGGRLAPLWSLNPAVSAGIDDGVQTALSADPGRRFPSVRAFAEALLPPGAAGARERVSISPAPLAASPEPESAGWQWPAWALGLGLAGWVLGWALAHAFPVR